MAEKYKNKYRIESARLKNWNYANNGYYFITICTLDRERLFGEVVNGKMVLNEFGRLVRRFWREIPKHFPGVDLDQYIVMPNHLHGIIVIDRETSGIPTNVRGRDVAMQRLYVGNETHMKNRTTNDGKRYAGKFPKMSKISPKSGSLSVIIRSYKSIVSDTIAKQYSDNIFAWQTRFYDHIIRNEKSLNRIRQYIIDNPIKWELDRNNPENLYM